MRIFNIFVHWFFIYQGTCFYLINIIVFLTLTINLDYLEKTLPKNNIFVWVSVKLGMKAPSKDSNQRQHIHCKPSLVPFSYPSKLYIKTGAGLCSQRRWASERSCVCWWVCQERPLSERTYIRTKRARDWWIEPRRGRPDPSQARGVDS